MNEEIGPVGFDYEDDRNTRRREVRRYQVAKEIYRDILRFAIGQQQRILSEEPIDFPAHATIAVEAAEEFLAALEPPADKVLPDYVG